MIVTLYNGKGERIEYRDYRLLIVVGKIYPGILVDRVRTATQGLFDDEQGGFRSGRR